MNSLLISTPDPFRPIPRGMLGYVGNERAGETDRGERFKRVSPNLRREGGERPTCMAGEKREGLPIPKCGQSARSVGPSVRPSVRRTRPRPKEPRGNVRLHQVFWTRHYKGSKFDVDIFSPAHTHSNCSSVLSSCYSQVIV